MRCTPSSRQKVCSAIEMIFSWHELLVHQMPRYEVNLCMY
jgi:hypothetical protein